MKEKILIVDDERDIVEMLDYNLKKEGYRTLLCYHGEDALKLTAQEQPDLIILDLMLTGIDGLEVCKTLKKETKTSAIPIIMLTAKAQETDKIIGLELGADDYVTKPFSPRELLARIKAILRRAQTKEKIGDVFQSGELKIDFGQIMVFIQDQPINLTAKEFELLKTLVQAKSRVLGRNFLLESIWGVDRSIELQTRTVDVHIQTLRKKLKNQSKRILTVKNYGYKFQ